jgi:uncharacterized repeat protein (TIGR03847 family)
MRRSHLWDRCFVVRLVFGTRKEGGGRNAMSEEAASSRGAGETQRIKAEAIGQPGERRFRLLAVINGETRIVWMEKEQLRRLAEALASVLENLPDMGPSSAPPLLIAPEFVTDTPFQIRAGRMELGYDEARNLLIIIAHELESTSVSSPAFECRITPAMAKELIEEAIDVVSSGRPICPLCARPMGPGDHVCAKQNGHFPHRLEEVQPEDDEDETV